MLVLRTKGTIPRDGEKIGLQSPVALCNSVSSATKEYQGKVVRREDTLQTLGYNDFTAPPVIHVRPVEEPREEPPATHQGQEAKPAPAAPVETSGGHQGLVEMG